MEKTKLIFFYGLYDKYRWEVDKGEYDGMENMGTRTNRATNGECVYLTRLLIKCMECVSYIRVII